MAKWHFLEKYSTNHFFWLAFLPRKSWKRPRIFLRFRWFFTISNAFLHLRRLIKKKVRDGNTSSLSMSYISPRRTHGHVDCVCATFLRKNRPLTLTRYCSETTESGGLRFKYVGQLAETNESVCWLRLWDTRSQTSPLSMSRSRGT